MESCKTKLGSKRHIYLSPFHDEFYKLLKENLLKKYQLVYSKGYEGELEITPVKIKEEYKRKIVFKTTLIEAWEGIYKLSGEEDILKVATPLQNSPKTLTDFTQLPFPLDSLSFLY